MNISELPEKDALELAESVWSALYLAWKAGDYQGFVSHLSSNFRAVLSEQEFACLKLSSGVRPFECVRRESEVSVMLSGDAGEGLGQLILTNKGSKIEVVNAQLC